MFPLLPGSAWADGELAELAGHVIGGTSQIKVNPTQLSDHMGHPVENPKATKLRIEGLPKLTICKV